VGLGGGIGRWEEGLDIMFPFVDSAAEGLPSDALIVAKEVRHSVC
jgi:hypothetical protein